MTEVAVATTSQLAADAASDVARCGGNAVDCALAAALLAMNTEPGVCALAGSAYVTVWAAGGDPLTMAFDLAVEATTEGKVMVVDVSGWRDATIGGGTKYSRLADTGAAGLVTDGLIRDSDELVNYGYAVYCAGFSPRSGTRNFRLELEVFSPWPAAARIRHS